jgi:hypothetical protein
MNLKLRRKKGIGFSFSEQFEILCFMKTRKNIDLEMDLNLGGKKSCVQRLWQMLKILNVNGT